MSTGHIRQRGANSFELKYEIGRDPSTGQRITRYATVRGTKTDARRRLRELLTAVDRGEHVEPSKITISEHVRARIEQWQAAGDISSRTAERYRELLRNQIEPHLGVKLVQKLSTLDIELWHSTLRARVSARTVGHAHRVLSHALRDAVRHRLVAENVAAIERAPRVDEGEVAGVEKERVGELIERLRGRAVYALAITALFTGMRRGELLALRWGAHVDVDAKLIRVRESIEETRSGLVAKAPKTRAGRRDVSLPDIVVDALREHRRQQLEIRMALGQGRLPDDALVFGAPLKGGYRSPRAFSKEWARVAASIGFPGLTFHALRHTHASQLIDAGIDIVTISKRLGHAKPDITLRVYAHLFAKADTKASEAINAALAGLGTAC